MTAFRQLGANVVDLHEVGHGVPDLLICHTGETMLIEIKSNHKAKYTPAELEFIANWSGRIETMRTVDDVIKLLQDN